MTIKNNSRHGDRPATLTPAAQYVRMSDEAQQYSIDNQKAAIQEYALQNGFVIVKTYADVGKSGVLAKNRQALRELLRDVVNGVAEYNAILVYDVSRWGRFPNSDEAAHYEFLCSDSGIPLHYCAEPFANDGTTSSSLLKSLKRSMAAEFSRELGEKVTRGKTRLVELGFWVGGQPGYGFRRLMVSATGKHKQTMKLGERKSLTTDRVILIPGPRNEIQCVRHIFSMALEGEGNTSIARELNRLGIICGSGRPWSCRDVLLILTNPKYAGCNVWRRYSGRLRSRRVRLEPQQWITKPGAFAPIIDQETFDRTQLARPKRADSLWSDEEILKRVRRLLRAKGRLSETLLRKARGMPSTSTIHKHFGTYRQLYERVGYHLPTEDILKDERSKCSLHLRRRLVEAIRDLFPENVIITHLPDRTRSMLLIDRGFMTAVLLCRLRNNVGGGLEWTVQPNAAEKGYITLLCPMNRMHDRVIGYYLLPQMDILRSHRMHKNDPLLRTATKIGSLAEFYDAVKRIWAERSGAV